MFENELQVFNCVSFDKLYAEKVLRFIWQIEREFSFNLRQPVFRSTSPLHSKIRRYTEGLVRKYKGIWVEDR